jgi:hypothetical protein
MTFLDFNFALKEEADKFMLASEGQPFEPRDRGGGPHWMYGYEGRTVKNRSPTASDRNGSSVFGMDSGHGPTPPCHSPVAGPLFCPAG